MPRYGPVWLEIAREHYARLPAETREQVDARIEELLENPRQQPSSAYDQRSDQWTTVYGDGIGLIVYAVVHDRERIIILRLV
jgi:mRNA-degrading endonuclease RelE of RelBE toxin-antitoxin system